MVYLLIIYFDNWRNNTIFFKDFFDKSEDVWILDPTSSCKVE